MENCILPLVYWGSIEYWKILLNAENFVIEANEFLPKQTIRTFCHILNANGIQKLSVPVNNPAQKTLIKIVSTDKLQRWQHNHWQSVVSAYRSAPFFEHYQPYIEAAYKYEQLGLFELNLFTIKTIFKILKLNREILFTQHYSYSYQNAKDYRNYRYFKKPLEKSLKPYHQVFSYKHPFASNMCILDLIFNMGPRSLNYLLME